MTMMRLLIIWLLLVGQAYAQSGTIVITDLPAETGDYYLVVRRAANGNVTAWRIQPGRIVVLGTGGPVTPTPPDGNHAKLRETVKTATAAVADPNKVNAQAAVSKLYSSLADLPFNTRSALGTSTDLMFNALGLGQPWAKWKNVVDEALKPFTILDEALLAWKVVAEAVK